MKQAYVKTLEKRLENLGSRKLIIFGTDELAEIVYNNLMYMRIEVSYFVDDSPETPELMDKRVVNYLELLKEKKGDIFILMVSFKNHGLRYEQLINLGFEYKIDFDLMNEGVYSDDFDMIDSLLGYNREEDIAGFRIYGDYNSKTALRIVTFGNSTSDPTVGNIDCWSKILYDKIKDMNKDVVLFCGGMGGYASSQELLKLIRDGILFNPHIVLTLSGVNDVNFATIDKEAIYVHRYQKKFYEHVSQTEGFAPDSLALRKINKIFYGFSQNDEDYQIWIDNMRKMYAISKEYNIKFFTFLQPMIYSEGCIIDEGINNLLELMEKHNNRMLETIKRQKFFCSEVRKVIKEANYMMDLSSLFQNDRGIFNDLHHVNVLGNTKIAEQIYLHIKQYL